MQHESSVPAAAGRFVRALLLVVVLALPLTGCLSGDVDVVIDDDGSGEVTVEVVPTGALGVELTDVDLQQVVDVAATGAGDVQFETFERDGRNGYRVSAEFDSYGEVLLALQGRAVVAGQPIGLLRSGELRELPDDGGWELTADVAPVADILGVPSSDDSSAVLEALIQAAADPTSGTGLDLSITLPGRVASSNADVVSGGTATWTLDSPDAPSTLRMRTEPNPLLTPERLLVGGALLAILVGVVLAAWGASRQYRVSRRAKRRRAKDARFPGGAPVRSGWEPPVGAASAGPGPAAGDRSTPLPPLPSLPSMSPESTPLSEPDAPVVTEIPAGWYADPTGDDRHRWWDGSDWTEHTR